MQRLWRPGSSGSSGLLILALVIAIVWLASGYYQIASTDRGVLQRFRRYVEIEQPGYGWHWPWPIETLSKVNVAMIDGLDTKSLMLTSDPSLVDVTWSVQFRTSEPTRYFYNVRDPETTLRQSAESVLRSLVVATPLQQLMNHDAWPRITTTARDRVQRVLDSYQAGIAIAGITLTNVQLPDEVQSAQSDAIKASDERQHEIATAQSEADRIVADAKSKAQAQIADAKVYATQTEAAADGEAERFDRLADAYAQSPEVTRKRMYLETMEGILSRSPKIVIDAKSGNGNVLYLPLDKIADAIRAGQDASKAVPAAVPAAGAPATDSAANSASTPPAGSATPAPAPAAASDSDSNANDARTDDDDRSRDREQR